MSAFFLNQVEIISVMAGLLLCHTFFFHVDLISLMKTTDNREQGLSVMMFLHFDGHYFSVGLWKYILHL